MNHLRDAKTMNDVHTINTSTSEIEINVKVALFCFVHNRLITLTIRSIPMYVVLDVFSASHRTPNYGALGAFDCFAFGVFEVLGALVPTINSGREELVIR